jgi:hypothetical protein
MFSSLDRADIVLKPDSAGRQRYVQTDHRTAEEIEQEPDLSVLFALVRILNPKRQAEPGAPEPQVLYVAQSPPPEFLRQAIRAAGGQVAIGTSDQPEPDVGEPPPLKDVANSAFAGLARAVAEEFSVELSATGLDKVEKALAASAGDPEEDEIAWWSAVIKLGSFAGELIRASNGGMWEVSDSGSLPFALSTRYRGGEATVNPLGKAIKRFTNGEGDSVAFLVDVVCREP